MYIYTRQLSGLYGLGNSQQTAKQIYAGQSLINPLTDANFWNIFSERDRVVVVNFWADSCGTCDTVAKIMTSVAPKYNNGVLSRLVKFHQIQWDPKVNPQIYRRFGFGTVPVTYFYFTSTGNPPSHAAPLLEGSLGHDKWQFKPEEYEWRIRSILRRHANEIRIILIDIVKFFQNKDRLRNGLISQLGAKFNNLMPDQLAQERLFFRVEYRDSEPTLQEKANFGRLDFPIYFMGRQHTFNTVRKLMEEHLIPDNIQCPRITKPANPYQLAEDWWNVDWELGAGIPSGGGFRKVGFIKTHKVAEDPIGSRDLPQAFLNVTAHELVHMMNICGHSKTGLMVRSVPLNVNVDFPPGYQGLVVSDLVRLRP